MGGGGEDAIEGGEFLGDETGDVAKVLALDEDEEVVSAAGEVAADDLVEAGDAEGETIEAAAALWGEADLDEGGDGGVADGLGIGDGVVAEDGAIFLPGGDLGGDF